MLFRRTFFSSYFIMLSFVAMLGLSYQFRDIDHVDLCHYGRIAQLLRRIDIAGAIKECWVHRKVHWVRPDWKAWPRKHDGCVGSWELAYAIWGHCYVQSSYDILWFHVTSRKHVRVRSCMIICDHIWPCDALRDLLRARVPCSSLVTWLVSGCQLRDRNKSRHTVALTEDEETDFARSKLGFLLGNRIVFFPN